MSSVVVESTSWLHLDTKIIDPYEDVEDVNKPMFKIGSLKEETLGDDRILKVRKVHFVVEEDEALTLAYRILHITGNCAPYCQYCEREEYGK